MAPTVVLAVGHDPLLLVTRGQVLQTAGFTVVSVCSLKEAITRFLQGDFDLVILCHSIPAQDRERLAHLIREHFSYPNHICFPRLLSGQRMNLPNSPNSDALDNKALTCTNGRIIVNVSTNPTMLRRRLFFY